MDNFLIKQNATNLLSAEYSKMCALFPKNRIIGSVNLESSRVQNMLTTTYKTRYGIAPPYLKSLLKERKVAYNLRGTLKLNLPRVTTTTYGLHIVQICCYPSMEYAA